MQKSIINTTRNIHAKTGFLPLYTCNILPHLPHPNLCTEEKRRTSNYCLSVAKEESSSFGNGGQGCYMVINGCCTFPPSPSVLASSCQLIFPHVSAAYGLIWNPFQGSAPFGTLKTGWEFLVFPSHTEPFCVENNPYQVGHHWVGSSSVLGWLTLDGHCSYSESFRDFS